jgi:hypothetical protein
LTDPITQNYQTKTHLASSIVPPNELHKNQYNPTLSPSYELLSQSEHPNSPLRQKIKIKIKIKSETPRIPTVQARVSESNTTQSSRSPSSRITGLQMKALSHKPALLPSPPHRTPPPEPNSKMANPHQTSDRFNVATRTRRIGMRWQGRKPTTHMEREE